MAALKTREAAVPTEPDQAELVLSQIESLPTLPAVAVRLLELTADDGASARDVIRLIESDQSLSARLVSLVRRASSGANVNTVDRAVVLLGLNVVRNLVLSVQIFETFSHRKERPGNHFDRIEFWKHGLAVGCAARLIAEEAARGTAATRDAIGAPPEEAFICGLLHDIGKVVLDACFPKSYDRVIARVEDRAESIAEVERDFFGLDHTLAGSRLAAHWRLPAMIAECVWLHHSSPTLTPTRLTHPRHVRLVQLADRLARQMRIGYSGNYDLDEPLSALIGSVGLSTEAVNRVMSALPELVEERAAFLGLDRFTSKQVYEGALARANVELARANEALAARNRELQERARCFSAITRLRTAISDVPSHERIALAAAGALAEYLQVDRAAVMVISQARGAISMAGASAAAGDAGTRDVVPSSEVGDLGFVTEARSGWLPASLLPGAVIDRASAALESPPAWCYALRNVHGFSGALLVSGERPAEDDDMLAVLADWVGTWLANAESAVAARHLNEELADLGRRLVASQAEVTRTRSVGMVGEMAAGAAHELNNPLAVISGRAQLLNRDGVDEEVRKVAALIAEHAHRASAIVNDLMAFAKPTPPKGGVFEISGLLHEVRRNWLDQKALADRQFTIHVSTSAVHVHADSAQIRTILDEIIRNAVEAMRDTPEPRLVVNCLADVADDKIVIKIQDNGCGMVPEVLERAFMPFFSHRQAGRGRGLGLAKAARYADINGGRLRLTSTPGQGTQAFLELPAARD